MRVLLLLLAAGSAAGWQRVGRSSLRASGAARSSRRLAPRRALKDTFEARMMSLPGKDELRRALSADGFVSAKAVDVTRAVREICQLQDCLPLAATALGRAVASTTLVADGLEAEETFQVRFAGDGPLRGVINCVETNQ